MYVFLAASEQLKKCKVLKRDCEIKNGLYIP